MLSPNINLFTDIENLFSVDCKDITLLEYLQIFRMKYCNNYLIYQCFAHRYVVVQFTRSWGKGITFLYSEYKNSGAKSAPEAHSIVW